MDAAAVNMVQTTTQREPTRRRRPELLRETLDPRRLRRTALARAQAGQGTKLLATWLLAWGAPGCGAPTMVDLVDVTIAPAAAPGTLVVAIDANAGLAETAGGPTVRRDASGKTRSGNTAGSTFVARWIERRGDWLLVEPIVKTDDPGARCSQPLYRLAGLELGVWVAASAAAPMVRQRTRTAWKDGTSITLEASTVLRPIERLDAGRGVYEVRIDDFAFRTIVPDAYVGTAAVPGKGWQEDGDALVAEAAPLTFGGGARVVPQHRYTRFMVRRVGQVDSGELVRLRLSCAEIVAIAPFGQLQPYGGGGLGVLGGMGNGAPKAWLRAGTQLLWSSGQRAGRTTKVIQLQHEAQAPNDRLRCFRQPLRWLPNNEAPSADESLLLCVDAASVQPAETLDAH